MHILSFKHHLFMISIKPINSIIQITFFFNSLKKGIIKNPFNREHITKHKSWGYIKKSSQDCLGTSPARQSKSLNHLN